MADEDTIDEDLGDIFLPPNAHRPIPSDRIFESRDDDAVEEGLTRRVAPAATPPIHQVPDRPAITRNPMSTAPTPPAPFVKPPARIDSADGEGDEEEVTDEEDDIVEEEPDEEDSEEQENSDEDDTEAKIPPPAKPPVAPQTQSRQLIDRGPMMVNPGHTVSTNASPMNRTAMNPPPANNPMANSPPTNPAPQNSGRVNIAAPNPSAGNPMPVNPTRINPAPMNAAVINPMPQNFRATNEGSANRGQSNVVSVNTADIYNFNTNTAPSSQPVNNQASMTREPLQQPTGRPSPGLGAPNMGGGNVAAGSAGSAIVGSAITAANTVAPIVAAVKTAAPFVVLPANNQKVPAGDIGDDEDLESAEDEPAAEETAPLGASAEKAPAADPARWNGVKMGVAFEGTLVILAVLVGTIFRVPTWQTIHWNLAGLAAGLLATIPLFALFIYAAHSKWDPLVRIREVLDQVLVPFLGTCSIVELAIISLLAGFGEELLFRGLLQGWITQGIGWPAALILVSLLFGVAHMATFGYFVASAIIGAFLGGLWIYTDNLLAPITAHAIYDCLALVYYLRWKPSFAEPGAVVAGGEQTESA